MGRVYGIGRKSHLYILHAFIKALNIFLIFSSGTVLNLKLIINMVIAVQSKQNHTVVPVLLIYEVMYTSDIMNFVPDFGSLKSL